jgi:hypothetical protein
MSDHHDRDMAGRNDEDKRQTPRVPERCRAQAPEHNGLRLEYLAWSQSIKIAPDGDAMVIRRVTVAPVEGELHFLFFNQIYYGAAPIPLRLRRRVLATAPLILVDGEEVRRAVTMTWSRGTDHQIQVHFPEAVPAGRRVTSEVRWFWPRYSLELMRGSAEDFDVIFDHPTVAATYEVTLMRRRSSDRFVASGIGPTKLRTVSSANSTTVRFSTTRPRLGTKLGVRLGKGRNIVTAARTIYSPPGMHSRSPISWPPA